MVTFGTVYLIKDSKVHIQHMSKVPKVPKVELSWWGCNKVIRYLQYYLLQ